MLQFKWSDIFENNWKNTIFMNNNNFSYLNLMIKHLNFVYEHIHVELGYISLVVNALYL